jgi:hypothetical protein
MQPRLQRELKLLEHAYPGLEYQASGQWIKLPRIPLPNEWTPREIEVAVQVPPSYPATPPYGIDVPAGLLFRGVLPNNYQEPAANQPPFPGRWGIFSWAPADGDWLVPQSEAVGRASLLAYIRGVGERFLEGV